MQRSLELGFVTVASIAVLFGACGAGPRPVPASASRSSRPAHLPEPAPAGRELAEALERLRSAEGADASGSLMSAVLSEDPARADQLLVALEGPGAAVVTNAFAFLPLPASIEMLRVALRHADPQVRFAAAVGVHRLGAPELVPDVLDVLANDSDLTRDYCGELRAFLVGAASPESFEAIATGLEMAPAVCEIESSSRALIGLRAGRTSPALVVPVVAHAVISKKIRELLGQHQQADVLAAVREDLARSWSDEQIVADAFFLDGAGDAQAGRVAGERLARLDETACDPVGGRHSPLDHRTCEVLRAVALAAGILRDPASAPRLERLAERAADAAEEDGRPSELGKDVLWARAFHGSAGDVSAEVRASIARNPMEIFARAVNLPRLPEAIVASALAGPPSSLHQGALCELVVNAGAPRWRESAWAALEASDSDGNCRGTAARHLAEEGTDEDRARLSPRAAAVVERLVQSGPSEDEPAVAWLEVLGAGPAAGRPSRQVLVRAVVAMAPHLLPSANDRFRASELTLRIVRSLFSGSTVTLSPGIVDRVLARTSGPRHAGPTVDHLIAGATDGDLRSWATALRAGGPQIEGRALAAMLASPGGRLRGLASELAGTTAAPAAAELVRVALSDRTVPAAPLVRLLARADDPLLTALLAARCDAACAGPLTAVLAGRSVSARRAAALVAAALGHDSLEGPLRRVARGTDEAALEAHVALALMGHPEPDGPSRAAEWARALQSAARGGNGDAEAQAEASKTLLVLSGLTAEARGPWLDGCREGNLAEELRSREPRRGRSYRDLRPALAIGAIVLRVLPGRLSAMEESAAERWEGSLEHAVSCLGEVVDAEALLRPAAASASAAARRAVARAAVSMAARRRRLPLLVELASDRDSAVRIALLGDERSVPDWLALLLSADPEPEVRARAVRALPVRDPDGWAAAGRALEDPSVDVRAAVVTNRGAHSSPIADRIAEVAAGIDQDTYWMVWREMEREGTPPGFLAALRQRIGRRDPSFREAVMLCQVGTAGDLPQVLRALRSLPERKRVELRDHCGSPRLLGQRLAGLARLVGDPDPTIVGLGLAMVRRVPEPAILDWLEPGLRHGRPEVRAEIARALPTQAVPAEPRYIEKVRALIRRTLEDRSDIVRCSALGALERARADAAELAELSGRTGADFPSLRTEWQCDDDSSRRRP